MNEDKGNVKETIQKYVKGYLNAESDLIVEAFHSETRLYTVDDGKLEKTEMKDWLENIQVRKQKGDLRTAATEIVSIDITETAATAKITLTFLKFKFTDYLSLLLIAGQWKIVGKIYVVQNYPAA